MIKWPPRGSVYANVIDVGGGASRLVDRKLTADFQRVAVLDIFATALEHAKARLGWPPKCDGSPVVAEIGDLGRTMFNPDADFLFQAQDTIVVTGKLQGIKKLCEENAL